MIKIHILSDIHLEFSDMEVPDVDADITIIAGDLHVGTKGLSWARKLGRPVFYVPGNHEFYGCDMNQIRNEFRQVRQTTILDNQLSYGGGCAIWGTTLWTDFKLNNDIIDDMYWAKRHMNDFKFIRYQNSILTPEDTTELHKESLQQLRMFQNNHYPVKVIVTHHLPSSKSIHPRYKGQVLNAAFASHLDNIIESSGIKLWIHGHTHHSFDYMIGSTRVICNPRGYPPFNKDFNPSLVVEI